MRSSGAESGDTAAANKRAVDAALDALFPIAARRQKTGAWGRLSIDLNFEGGKIRNWRIVEEHTHRGESS